MPIKDKSHFISIIREQFALDWRGIHGAPHWARVRMNGLELARSTGANVRVIECFAFLHDARRMNDGIDPEHGHRAAEFAMTLRDLHLTLDDEEFRLLQMACRGHSEGLLEADMTVMTCWDADRLDLGRVGIRPNPQYLCTPVAREATMIEWAYERSLRGIDFI